jgi:hypothetical protein
LAPRGKFDEHVLMRTPFLLAIFCVPLMASARLGETEAQSQTRYGPPDEALAKGNHEPLLPGAKEVFYRMADWRIRAAFIGGVAVKLEYFKMKGADGTNRLTDEDIESILEAEKGKFSWRGNVMGPGGKRAVRKEEDAKSWERSDRATAQIHNVRIVVQSRDAEELAEKAAKAQGAKNPAPATPKPRF